MSGMTTRNVCVVFHANTDAVRESGRSAFDCEAVWPDEFQAVAVIGGIEDVGEAFQLTNHIDSAWWENEGVTRIGGETRSTSVGDVVVLNGEAFMVKGCGFAAVATPEAA